MPVAVSVAALSTSFPAVPNQSHPFIIERNGQFYIDPVWHRYLVIERDKWERLVVELVNAIRTEVNTQHP